MSKSIFETLSAINVNDKVEKKSNLTYLSWAWAWGEVKKTFPSAVYNVVFDPNTNKPYFYDETLGYMVMTSVTIEGQTLEMWLPVMDGANQAMKAHAYEYSTRYGVKTVDAATMFDINKTLMRCLTKNLAMFGLGHYIYAGEDLPEVNETPKAVAPKKAAAKKEKADENNLLVLGDNNWDKVKSYVEANKANGFEAIIGQLLRKYVITGDVIEEIKKIVG
jgi:hypothetical protein